MQERTISGKIKAWAKEDKIRFIYKRSEQSIYSRGIMIDGGYENPWFNIIGDETFLKSLPGNHVIGSDVSFIQTQNAKGFWNYKDNTLNLEGGSSDADKSPTTANNPIVNDTSQNIEQAAGQHNTKSEQHSDKILCNYENISNNLGFDKENRDRLSHQSTINSAVGIVKLAVDKFPIMPEEIDNIESMRDYLLNLVTNTSDELQRYLDNSKPIPEEVVELENI